MNPTTIQLAHGSGGSESQSLVHDLFYRYFDNDILSKSEDAAVLETGKIAMSTDSFTVSPLFFSGGDIGKLAIAGTCNDVAMMGAKPHYLSAAVIIEEGFSFEELERIVKSMAGELEKNGAKIVCGDTKVVPKGSADGLYINTTGIGEIIRPGLSATAIEPGDLIFASGPVGDHGATIFANREGIDLSTDLKSDCASLWPLVAALIDADVPLVAMRDATRGGLAAVLNEWAQSSRIALWIDETAIPVKQQVKGICELLGFEPYNLANEGMMVIAVRPEGKEKALKVLQDHPLGNQGALIGEAGDEHPGRVLLKSGFGTTRYLEAPSGELLPRIC